MLRLLKRWAATEGLDDLFVAHYAQLVSWAEQLVGRDRAAAEDLVHDTFVRVALRKPDLGAVSNLEGYLFVTMRNVHLSRVRRRAAGPFEVASLDYGSVAARLAAIDTHRQRQTAYDELTLIACYACMRKSTSKAASALILRFFHGYYPTEIARLLQTTVAAVDTRLRIARAEAQAFVADPKRLRPFGQRQPLTLPSDATRDEGNFVALLRQTIFDARTGACLASTDIDHLYAGQASDPIDVRTLAHLVSCPSCLDVLNRRFGIPLLKDRDPSDMLGRGGRQGGPKGGGEGMGTDPKTELRTRLKDVLDDRPKELRIAVNGLFVGSQAVSGDVSEQRVKILISERIGFIEVFSEYGTCLLYLDVDAPPDAPAEQAAHVALSDGRRLAATLTFGDAAPVLDVVYEAVERRPVRSDAAVEIFEAVSAPHRSTWRRLFAGPPWRRAFAVTTALAVCTAVLWAWAMWHSPRVSAAEVLRDARAAESRLAPAGMAAHRLLMLEDRLLPNGNVIRRSRIEIWQDASRGLQVRRLFDERSQVVAGLWSRTDGTRTIYRAGARPSIGAGAQPIEPVTARNVWLHGPSADDFIALVGQGEDPSIEVGETDYVLTYRPRPAPSAGLIEATLTVEKADGRSTAATYVLRDGDESHAFTFRETLLERLPVESVLPKVFEPETVLVGEPVDLPPPTMSRELAAPRPIPAAPVASEARLNKVELDATYRLYRSRIWLGQDAEIARTAEGIAVRVAVTSEERESALRQSFEELMRDPSVTLDIAVGTAASADRAAVAPDALPLSTMPAYPMLQSFFGAVAPNARDEVIQAFANRVIERVAGRQERLQALETLIARWPDERLRQVQLEAIVTWQVMIQEHADAIRRDTELLRVQLASVFKVAAVLPGRSREALEPLTTVAGAVETSAQLVALVSEQDAALRAAFAACQNAECRSPDVDRLMQSFVSLESAASRFTRFYLKMGRES